MTAETRSATHVEVSGQSELTVRGPDLTLRYARPDDAPRLFALASDPNVTEFFSWGPYTTQSQAADYIANLARKRADIPAEQTLAEDAGTVGAGDWPAPIIALYLGRITAESAQKAAASPDPARQRDQRCEANFYIAQWHLLRGEREAALQLLRNAQSGCPGSIVEHEATVAELRRLAQKR